MLINPQKGEIWDVDLEPIRGVEKGKKRPSIVISNSLISRSRIRFIVPVTDYKEAHEKFLWMVAIEPDSGNNLRKKSTIDCMHIRSVDISRCEKRIGRINADLMRDVTEAVKFLLQ